MRDCSVPLVLALLVAACAGDGFDGSVSPIDEGGSPGSLTGAWDGIFDVASDFRVLDVSAGEFDVQNLHAEVNITNLTDIVQSVAVSGCPFQFLAYADVELANRVWVQESHTSPLSTARAGCTANILGFDVPPGATVVLGETFVGLVDDIAGGRPPQQYYFTLIIETVGWETGEPDRMGEFGVWQLSLPE